MKLLKKCDFDSDANEIAICGYQVKETSYHVGIFWRAHGEKKIIHFLNGNHIPIEDYNSNFDNYYFNALNEFPSWKLNTFIAFAQLASQNKLNCFVFDREIGCYNGGGFDFNTGDYNCKRVVDRYINCGVFVLAFLKTFDYELLEHTTWPTQNDLSILKNWLKDRKIPKNEWGDFVKQVKELRGKHVLVAPSSEVLPATYDKVNELILKLL